MLSLKSLAAGALALIAAAAFAQDSGSLVPNVTPAAATAPAPAAAASPVATPVLDKADLDAWLDGYLPYAIQTGDIAGAVVTIVKDGKVLTARGYGYADTAKRLPVDPDKTLFRPGSVSKLVTWTAVMQLVEAGKIDLDRDINAYLDFKIPPRDGKPVTMRQVMQHTAGFEETARDLIADDPKRNMPIGIYLKRYVPARIFAPGTTPAYSNWATTLAGYVVERVAGMPFDDYLDRYIFAPLGMTNSTFRQPLPARLKGQMSAGYPRASEPAQAFEIVIPAPAGSLSSTGTDMARFMLAHLQGGALGSNRILGADAAATMHNSPLTVLPPLNRMELGFFETNVNGREVIAHLGDTQLFHTSLHLFLADGVGLYVSFNSGGKEGAAGTLRSALFHDFADRYFPLARRDGQVDAKTAAAHAELMAGSWGSSRGWQTSFLKLAGLLGQSTVTTNDKGDLVVSSLLGRNGVPRAWVEIAPFVWRDRDGPDRLAAKVVDGKVVRWSMDFMSPFIVMDRVPAGESATWIVPALGAALGVLALTFLYWPGAWLVRRRFKAPLSVTGNARRAYRATRIVAGLTLLVPAGWLAIVALLEDATKLNTTIDPLLWLLQIGGAIVFVGAVVIAAWNVWLTWSDGRGWTRKLWSLLILLAALVVLYVAHTFGLLAMTVNY